MIQVRKIREFVPDGQSEPAKYDKALEPDLVYSDLRSLLSNPETIIDQVNSKERYNLFVTLWHQSDNPEARAKKVWAEQDIMMFDIDGIDPERDRETDEIYLNILAKTINCSPNSIVQIFSGGGYHFLINLKTPIKEDKYFDENRIYYQVLCSRINDMLRDKDLPGEMDAGVFAKNRMFRLPHSINQKPNRPKCTVKLLQLGSLEPVDFDVQKASGLPAVNKADYMSEKELSYIKVDSDTVQKECEFLKWSLLHQHEMNEPQWYAMLSIIYRLDDGKELIHEYSRQHPSYNAAQTDRKAEQAVRASGPRTCDSINNLWGNCKNCPHYKKLRSPISIKGEDFIATSHSGFHAIGARGKLTPQYDDLRKFYQQANPYKNIVGSHYRYETTHWDQREDVYIDSFSEQHFYPKASNTMANEFRGKVKRTNLDSQSFFRTTTNRRLNLANGVLNIDTRELEDHDPKFGFRSTLPFEYDPNATAPTFQKMLEAVTCGDKEMQATLMQYFGYCISNDEPRADKILVLTGKGQNGKSRFLNVIRAIGGTSVTNLGVKDIENPFHLQKLDGALFNILEEVPSFTDKEFWETMKSLIAGGSATVSRKFKDAFDFQNKAKFIMTCNDLPKGATPNHGYFRRLLIVPFNATFSHEKGNIDVKIDQKVIDNELPGVLNMMLDGYEKLIENNYEFEKSSKIDESLKEYKTEMDSVRRWSDDNLTLGLTPQPTNETPEWVAQDAQGRGCVNVEELYKTYADHTKEMGEKPVAFKVFTKRLYDSFDAVSDGVPTDLEKLDHPVHCRIRLHGARRRVMYGVTFFSDSSH